MTQITNSYNVHNLYNFLFSIYIKMYKKCYKKKQTKNPKRRM